MSGGEFTLLLENQCKIDSIIDLIIGLISS